MKTAELEGAALDYYVAKAEGLDIEAVRNGSVIIGRTPNRYVYSPSTNWQQGGPIIERGIICLCFGENQKYFPGWAATIGPEGYEQDPDAYGHTPLIAAMRAFVASRFGDEVPDIKETA